MSTLRTSNLIHGSSSIKNIVLDTQGRAIFGPNSAQGRASLYVNPQNNRVGINNESPAVALDVDGAINATGNVAFDGTLNVTGDFSVASSVLFVDVDKGSVGINTTTFNAESSGRNILELAGGAGGALINLTTQGTRRGYLFGGNPNIFLYNVGDGFLDFGTNNLSRMQIDNEGNVGINTNVVTNNINRATLGIQGAWGGQLDIMVGTVVHAQFGTDNFNTGQSCRILSQDGIVLRTGGNNERVRIDDAGNVGIGTPSPTRPLTVSSPAGSTNILGVFDNSAGAATNCVIAFSDPTSTGGQFSTRLGSKGDALAFYTDGANERMQIDSSGRVLVGTSSSITGDIAQVNGTLATSNFRSTNLVPFTADGTWQDIIPSTFSNIAVMLRAQITGPGRHCSTVAFASTAFGDGEVNMLVNSSHNNIPSARIEFRWNPIATAATQALQIRTNGNNPSTTFAEVSILYLTA